MTITTYTDREIAMRQQLAAATQLAQLNGEIAAELKADKLALEAAIAASRKQQAVAWMRKDGDMITALEKRTDYAYTHYYDRPLYAAPVVAPDVLKDAVKQPNISEYPEKDISALEPSCTTCKHYTVADQESFEETCFVCCHYYDSKYEAKT